MFRKYCSTLLILALCCGSSIVRAQTLVVPLAIEFWDDREELSRMRIDHSEWQSILDKYLDDDHGSGINRFAYNSVTNGDKLKLQNYLEYLQSFEPRQLNNNEQKAYWINLFNSMTIFVILREEDEGLNSIRQIRSGFLTAGPWELNSIKIAQQNLSLDDLENGILRPILKDSRILYLLNHASLGDPNLFHTALTGDNIEASLEQAAKDFINHQRAVSIEGGTLILSEVYFKYASDFGTDFKGLISHLKKYINLELSVQLERFSQAEYQYDWSLNRPE